MWDHLAGTVSAPFTPDDAREIAVKVIDDRGNELLVVKSLDEAEMSAFEVEQPILNSPFDEPAEHWQIEDGHAPARSHARRRAGYFYRDPKAPPPRRITPPVVSGRSWSSST